MFPRRKASHIGSRMIIKVFLQVWTGIQLILLNRQLFRSYRLYRPFVSPVKGTMSKSSMDIYWLKVCFRSENSLRHKSFEYRNLITILTIVTIVSLLPFHCICRFTLEYRCVGASMLYIFLRFRCCKLCITGYAWSGGGQKIVRVDVTADAGKTWHVANFDAQDIAEPPQHWAWTLWSARIPIQKGFKNVCNKFCYVRLDKIFIFRLRFGPKR